MSLGAELRWGFGSLGARKGGLGADFEFRSKAALTTPAHVSLFRDIRDKVIDRLISLRDSRRGKMYKPYLEYRFEGGKLAASECIYTSYEETMKKFEEQLESCIKYGKDHPVYHGTEYEERAEGIKEAIKIFREEFQVLLPRGEGIVSD